MPKSLQTKQMTTGEDCSRWSYTFSVLVKGSIALRLNKAIGRQKHGLLTILIENK